MKIAETWPSVNYAKDWLDHSFLSLVLSSLEKSFTLDVITRGSQHPFSCVLGHFRHGDERTNNQPGDPSASLLLTSVRRQSFAKYTKQKLDLNNTSRHIVWNHTFPKTCHGMKGRLKNAHRPPTVAETSKNSNESDHDKNLNTSSIETEEFLIA